jgi:hypothetical protein
MDRNSDLSGYYHEGEITRRQMRGTDVLAAS